MKKVVLKLDVHDGKCKQRAMKIVSSIPGVDSISMDLKEQKVTLIGDIDPVAVVSKLRKVYQTEIISVGPAKEPEKKKDEPKKEASPKKEEPKKKDGPNKKDGPKKDEPKKDQAQVVQLVKAFESCNYPLYPKTYYVRSMEEDPNACVIC